MPFRERLVPGFTLQVQKPDAYWIDFNPSLRYKARGYLSFGMGWNQRLSLEASGRYRSLNGVYGVRTFAELAVLKGFSARLDVESMNCFVPFSRQQLDVGQRQWVWSYLLGIKKDFTFSPGFLGNVQFVYNLYDPHGWSPYLNRFNVRFGLEFPLKKQSAKEPDK